MRALYCWMQYYESQDLWLTVLYTCSFVPIVHLITHARMAHPQLGALTSMTHSLTHSLTHQQHDDVEHHEHKRVGTLAQIPTFGKEGGRGGRRGRGSAAGGELAAGAAARA